MAPPRRITPHEETLIIDAYRHGFSSHTIAPHVDLTAMGVLGVLDRNGVVKRRRGDRSVPASEFAAWRAGWEVSGTDTIPAPTPADMPKGGRWVSRDGVPVWVADEVTT